TGNGRAGRCGRGRSRFQPGARSVQIDRQRLFLGRAVIMLRVRDRFRRTAAPPPQATVLREDVLLSSELMTSLRRMRISAPRVQRGTFAGEHRSRRRGTSPEFTDFKSYTPGDDIRRVDWNLYA